VDGRAYDRSVGTEFRRCEIEEEMLMESSSIWAGRGIRLRNPGCLIGGQGRRVSEVTEDGETGESVRALFSGGVGGGSASWETVGSTLRSTGGVVEGSGALWGLRGFRGGRGGLSGVIQISCGFVSAGCPSACARNGAPTV
jgi:hypothetical protein